MERWTKPREEIKQNTRWTSEHSTLLGLAGKQGCKKTFWLLLFRLGQVYTKRIHDKTVANGWAGA